jgi:hypothetical protein
MEQMFSKSYSSFGWRITGGFFSVSPRKTPTEGTKRKITNYVTKQTNKQTNKQRSNQKSSEDEDEKEEELQRKDLLLSLTFCSLERNHTHKRICNTLFLYFVSVMRQLKHHEQKLLRKVSLYSWNGDDNLRVAKIMRRYHIQNREDYVAYSRISGMITKLAAKLKVCGVSALNRRAHGCLEVERSSG